MAEQVQYTEDNIRSLDWKEHIRMRPGDVHREIGRRQGRRRRHLRAPEGGDRQQHRRVHHGARTHHRGGDQGRRSPCARLRPWHSFGEGGRLRVQNQHRRQVRQPRVQEVGRIEWCGHQGGERVEHRIRGGECAGGPNEARRLRPRRAHGRRQGGIDHQTQRHAHSFQARPGHLQSVPVPDRARGEVVVELRLPQHRPHALPQRREVSGASTG